MKMVRRKREKQMAGFIKVLRRFGAIIMSILALFAGTSCAEEESVAATNETLVVEEDRTASYEQISPEEAKKIMVKEGKTYIPDAEKNAEYKKMFENYEKIYTAARPLM